MCEDKGESHSWVPWQLVPYLVIRISSSLVQFCNFYVEGRKLLDERQHSNVPLFLHSLSLVWGRFNNVTFLAWFSMPSFLILAQPWRPKNNFIYLFLRLQHFVFQLIGSCYTCFCLLLFVVKKWACFQDLFSNEPGLYWCVNGWVRSAKGGKDVLERCSVLHWVIWTAFPSSFFLLVLPSAPNGTWFQGLSACSKNMWKLLASSMLRMLSV